MLNQLPSLLDELDTRIERLDRINTGTIGRRSQRPDEINAIDFDAAETARKIRKKLTKWVQTIAQQHTGRPPPTLHTITTQNLARWLKINTPAIAQLQCAGQLYHDIHKLVGTPDHAGQLQTAIDIPQPTTRFIGPCIHYIENNRHCATLLYAKPEATQVTCPSCRTTHNIQKMTQYLENRADVMRFTATEILTIMAQRGTPIPPRSWSRWRKNGRIKIRGYKRPDNPDGTRGSIGLNRRTDDDEPVYRLSEVRKTYATAIQHIDALKDTASTMRHAN
jgi:hypothetical protein